MASRRSADASRSVGPELAHPLGATASEAIPSEDNRATWPDWIAQAAEQGIKPEQALAFIGLGLMRRMAAAGQDQPWIWNDEQDGGQADLAGLRQRLELTQLALQTGAPLSTAEVSQLLGARPGAAQIERGGLVARRLSRNVWKLSRAAESAERASTSFSEGFRRRL
ncbi:MAG: hypothetical protein WCI65_06570 [Synechococcaceae cyanobacterium ELA263]